VVKELGVGTEVLLRGLGEPCRDRLEPTSGTSSVGAQRLAEVERSEPASCADPKPLAFVDMRENKPDALEREELEQALASGESVAAIARRAGCSAQTVYAHLDRQGLRTIERRGERPTTTALRKAYRGGSVTTVAREFGVARSLAHRWLREAGIELRHDHPGGPRRDFDVDSAVRRYEAGDSLQTIADDTAASASTIRRRLLERGVALRPRH
jgi:transposase-like protein